MDRIMFHCLGVLTSLCLCAFTFLLVLDLRSAFHKRATWIPGKALVLGAFTIQLLSFVAGTNISLLQDLVNHESAEDFLNYANLSTIIVCETNISVFLVYFMPGMVSKRSTDHLAAIIVFIIGVHIPLKDFFSSSDNERNSISQSGSLFQFMFIRLLILLLGSVLIAGITVRRILEQRISATLSTDKDEEVQLYSRETDERISCLWNDFEDELFKLWIVARVSQPDYVIARSILTSAAWNILLFCIVGDIIFFADALSWNGIEKPKQPLILLLCVYVLVEWIVICCRWYSSLLIRKRRFCFEDFWTRALHEIINKYDHLQKWRPASRRDSLEISLPRIVALLRLHKLLYLVWVLQILVVSVSKFSWVLSDFLFGKIARQCRKCAWSLRERVFKPTVARYQYESYASVIERICMPGENPSDLWEANKRAINRVAHLFKKGREEGSITNCLFTRPFSMEWVDRGFQLLDKLQNKVLPEIVEYFPNSENRCWKMAVVSLTLFVIELTKRVKSDRVTNAFHACNNAWDFLSFLDENDSLLSSDSFNSGAADKELSGLRHLYGSHPSIWLEESARKITIEEAKNLCKCPGELKEINSIVGKIQGRADHYAHSKDWMRIAPRYYLYKLCKVMEEDLGIENMEDLEEQAEADTAEDLISWAESSLRNVIVAGVWTVPDMLAKHCRKCVQGFD